MHFTPAFIHCLACVAQTEGYDFEVLKQFPFERLRPARVVFETAHLSSMDNNAAASFMMRHGYANVLGGLGKVMMSIWHDPNSTEVWKEAQESSV